MFLVNLLLVALGSVAAGLDVAGEIDDNNSTFISSELLRAGNSEICKYDLCTKCKNSYCDRRCDSVGGRTTCRCQCPPYVCNTGKSFNGCPSEFGGSGRCPSKTGDACYLYFSGNKCYDVMTINCYVISSKKKRGKTENTETGSYFFTPCSADSDCAKFANCAKDYGAGCIAKCDNFENRDPKLMDCVCSCPNTIQ